MIKPQKYFDPDSTCKCDRFVHIVIHRHPESGLPHPKWHCGDCLSHAPLSKSEFHAFMHGIYVGREAESEGPEEAGRTTEQYEQWGKGFYALWSE